MEKKKHFPFQKKIPKPAWVTDMLDESREIWKLSWQGFQYTSWTVKCWLQTLLHFLLSCHTSELESDDTMNFPAHTYSNQK